MVHLESSPNLDNWTVDSSRLVPMDDQSGLPAGFVRYAVPFHIQDGREFLRVRVSLQ